MTSDRYDAAVAAQTTARLQAETRRRYAKVYTDLMAVDGMALANYAFEGFAKVSGMDANGPAEVIRLADYREGHRC